MTQEFNVQEYNRMCAEFLGWTYNKFAQRWNDEDFHHDYCCVGDDELKFHSDWNWIMEVVEKINKYKPFEVFITKNQCTIGMKGHNENTTKEAVVQAIWEFLQWYNTQNKKS